MYAPNAGSQARRLPPDSDGHRQGLERVFHPEEFNVRLWTLEVFPCDLRLLL